jgi:hypothetical protein
MGKNPRMLDSIGSGDNIGFLSETKRCTKNVTFISCAQYMFKFMASSTSPFCISSSKQKVQDLDLIADQFLSYPVLSYRGRRRVNRMHNSSHA